MPTHTLLVNRRRFQLTTNIIGPKTAAVKRVLHPSLPRYSPHRPQTASVKRVFHPSLPPSSPLKTTLTTEYNGEAMLPYKFLAHEPNRLTATTLKEYIRYTFWHFNVSIPYSRSTARPSSKHKTTKKGGRRKSYLGRQVGRGDIVDDEVDAIHDSFRGVHQRRRFLNLSH